MNAMIGRPQAAEAAPYYFTYINQVTGEDPVATVERQLEECLPLLSAISEEKSLHRYAPDKWSIRQVLNHVTDTERAFAFRALSFAHGLESPLPSYDQNVAASALRPTGSPGPPTSRSSGACASPPFRFSGICHRRRGREAASPATITSPCVPWPTSSPDTLPTTSRCCASDICRDFLPMPRSFAAFETVGKVGISVSAAQANRSAQRCRKKYISAAITSNVSRK